MNKSISKFLAASMAATMLLSTSAFAADATLSAQAGSISNEIEVKKPVYSIVVPEKLQLSLNPLMLGDVESQIYTAPFGIVNKSNVALDVKLTVGVKTGTAVTPYTAANQATEDLVLAASADVASKDKKFSIYVAPAVLVTSAVADPYDTIDVSDDTKVKFAKPTSYVGVGTTGAAINFALSASDAVSDTAYTKPGSAAVAKKMMTAFILKGSLNKNCEWKDNDITPAVSYQFGGVDAETFDAVVTLPRYADGKVTKVVNGTGSSVVLTPRLRDKMVKPTTATTDVAMQVELGSTMATYVADNKADATIEYGVSAITLMKNGVADTTTIPAAKLAKITVTIAPSGDEAGLLATLTMPNGDITLQPGATYTITGFSLKAFKTATPATALSTFVAVPTVNYGTQIVVPAT